MKGQYDAQLALLGSLGFVPARHPGSRALPDTVVIIAKRRAQLVKRQ